MTSIKLSILAIHLLCINFYVDAHFQPNIGQLYQQPQHAHVQNNVQQAQYVQHQPQQAHYAQHSNHQVPNNILHDQARIKDKEHLRDHLGDVLSDSALNQMSEEELQFYYYKVHDTDNNNKLDGSELIKSLIHWHIEESKQLGPNSPPAGTTKIFNDEELSNMIDPILESDDKNKDGYIDYTEFVMAQKSRSQI